MRGQVVHTGLGLELGWGERGLVWGEGEEAELLLIVNICPGSCI